jgi:tetratricopeptide (TPR) repeat protein
MSLLLALALQVGPHVGSGNRPVSPLPPELRNRPARRTDAPPPPIAVKRDRLGDCLARAESDAAGAIAEAREWQRTAQGSALGEAGHCMGVALAKAQRWSEAEAALVAARDAAGGDDHEQRARMGALAGYAALEGGRGAHGLSLLDQAVGDADLAGDVRLAGEIERDRARALVQARRDLDAAKALTRARSALPTDPETWLLSATLSRRMRRLAEAQVQIEEAARLAPDEPLIGLEAGVIAMIAGREQAATRSWQSVVALAPDSEAAKMARAYLAQIAQP